jgi:hypothetical protein
MTHITATEIQMMQKEYENRVFKHGDKFAKYLNKKVSKLSLRILTNQGPVLGFVETVVVINKLGDKK